jgi:hypothetical protein
MSLLTGKMMRRVLFQPFLCLPIDRKVDAILADAPRLRHLRHDRTTSANGAIEAKQDMPLWKIWFRAP